MSSSLPAPISLALESIITSRAPEQWDVLRSDARTIASALISDEIRTVVGDSGVIAKIAALLPRSIPQEQSTTTELLRIVGNLCFDHDVNRQKVLEASITTFVFSALVAALESRPPRDGATLLSIDTLKLIRAAIGALLNSSHNYEPISAVVRAPENLEIMCRIFDTRGSQIPIYIINSWSYASEEELESLSLGSTIFQWTMNVINDLVETDKSTFPASSLPSLISLLQYAEETKTLEDEDLLQTDIEILTAVGALIEALSLDSDSCKQALGLDNYTTTPPLRILRFLFSFLADSASPSTWTTDENEKAFGLVKAAIGKAVIEACNEDWVLEKMTVLDEGGNAKEGWIVEEMIHWISKVSDREDLITVATHVLAGIGRNDTNCLILAQKYHVLPSLVDLLTSQLEALKSPPQGTRPGGVAQSLFGIVSLLRHLSIPKENKAEMAQYEIVKLVTPLLETKLDVVAPLQTAVVGLIKHLSSGNLSSSVAIVTESVNGQSPLAAILDIIKRTDDVKLRSEASRILVNVVRSVFTTTETGSNISEAAKLIVQRDVVEQLSEMVRLSEKYPILINEGIVGLTLLAGSGPVGASMVLEALLVQHAPVESPHPEAEEPAVTTETLAVAETKKGKKRTVSLAVSPTGDPPCSLDMVVSWFGLAASNKLSSTATRSPSSAEISRVQPEMVMNACALIISVLQICSTLLGQIFPNGPAVEKSMLDNVKAKVFGPAEGMVRTEGYPRLKEIASQLLTVIGRKDTV